MQSQQIDNLAIDLGCSERINISLLHARLESLVRELRILNLSNETFTNISVSLRSPQLAECWYLDLIEELKPGGDRFYSNFTPGPLLFHKLDSPLSTCIEIYLNEQLRVSRPITVLPINSWDQMPGHELALASFVFYLSEEISSIVRRAHHQPELILQGQGFPNLSPLDATKALYNTLKEFCPPSAHDLGTLQPTNQLIRFPNKILKDWRGTCIDLALVFAAAIENIRCYPVIFILNMRKGGRHALAGFWNLRNPYIELPHWDINYPIPSSIITSQTSKTNLLKLIDAEVLIPLDPDALHRKHHSFERCVEGAVNLIRDNSLCSMHDIESARQNGINPLPLSTALAPSRSSTAVRSPDRHSTPQTRRETGEAAPELIESLARRRCVLFIGDKLSPPGGTDGPLTKTQLAERLARSCGHGNSNEGLNQVAQYYEDKLGRDQLVRETQESLHNSQWLPPRIFQLIAQLPLELVVSFYYDNMLETALVHRKVPFVTVFKDEQIGQITTNKATLVKLYGCAAAGEPLILTSDDQLDLFQRKPVLSKFVKARISNRELLLLGCDLHDFTFKELYRDATQHLSFLTHKAYVVNQTDDSGLDYWHQEGLVMIRAEPEPFLSSLLEVLPQEITAPSSSLSPATASQRPYKFLDYFNTEDEAIFFGREHEINEFYQELLASRGVAILCGKSGDGKTSLIKAGVIPMLRREHDWLITYTRCGIDAEQAIKQEVSSVLLEAGIRIENAPEELAEFLRHVSEQTQREMIVVIDQFEEFFIKLGIQVQTAFFEKLSKCIYDSSIGCRFIIVIREDYLPYLTEPAFTDRLTLLPRYVYRLPELSREGALRAIVEPARKFGLAFEADLPDSILDDLSPDTIVPAQLQIVCSKLNDALGESGLFSNELYEELGRSRRILEAHLNEAICQFSDADAASVRLILKAMVTSEATKDLLTEDGIVARAGVAVNVTRQLLQHLIHQHRLIREVVGNELQYELSHECLAPAISAWLAEEERRLREVQELLGRETANLLKFPDFIIERDRLNIIHEWSSKLALTEKATSLILLSIFHHKSYFLLDRFWINQSKLVSIEHAEALLDHLSRLPEHVLSQPVAHPLHLLQRALSESKGQELLDREVANWQRSPDLLIGTKLLGFFNGWWPELSFNDDSRLLILLSIIRHREHDMLDDFWLGQADALPPRHTDVLIDAISRALSKRGKKSAAPLYELRKALVVKKEQYLLDREVANCQRSPDMVIDRKLLRRIHQSPTLKLTDDARLVVLSSIIRHRTYKMLDSFWVEQLALIMPVKYTEATRDDVQKLLDHEPPDGRSQLSSSSHRPNSSSSIHAISD
jgi:SIR2-like domain